MGWRNRAAALVGVVALSAGIGLPLVATEAGAIGTPSSESPAPNSLNRAVTDVRASYSGQVLDQNRSSIHVFNDDNGGAEVAGNTNPTNGAGQTAGDTLVWKKSDGSDLTTGHYRATATAVSVQPGDSPSTFTWHFTVDSDTPPPPVVSSVTDPIGSANASNVHVQGTAEPGSTVTAEFCRLVNVMASPTLCDASPKVSGSAAANAITGAYDVTVDVSSFRDGTLHYTVTDKDAAGNVNTDGTQGNVTKNASPGAPTVSIDSKPVTGANVGALPVTVSGATAGSSVKITVDDDDT